MNLEIIIEFIILCRVKHLILADPWGFPEKPKEISAPLWVRAIAKIYGNVNPLWILRAGMNQNKMIETKFILNN